MASLFAVLAALVYKDAGHGVVVGLAVLFAMLSLGLFSSYSRAILDPRTSQLVQTKSRWFRRKSTSFPFTSFTSVKVWERQDLSDDGQSGARHYAVILVGPKQHLEVQQSQNRARMTSLAQEIGAYLQVPVEEGGVDADEAGSGFDRMVVSMSQRRD
jgi:hypothetical protein